MNPLKYPDNLHLQAARVLGDIPDAIHLCMCAVGGTTQLDAALNWD
ncbi:MAG: hypothetical protein WCH99_15210 [Verrucomicrobiota bacterium]